MSGYIIIHSINHIQSTAPIPSSSSSSSSSVSTQQSHSITLKHSIAPIILCCIMFTRTATYASTPLSWIEHAILSIHLIHLTTHIIIITSSTHILTHLCSPRGHRKSVCRASGLGLLLHAGRFTIMYRINSHIISLIFTQQRLYHPCR
jgi:hypothetical protein